LTQRRKGAKIRKENERETKETKREEKWLEDLLILNNNFLLFSFLLFHSLLFSLLIFAPLRLCVKTGGAPQAFLTRF
jgi:hypothetical protein